MLSQGAWPREMLASPHTNDYTDALLDQTHTCLLRMNSQTPNTCGADNASRGGHISVSRVQTATSQRSK